MSRKIKTVTTIRAFPGVPAGTRGKDEGGRCWIFGDNPDDSIGFGEDYIIRHSDWFTVAYAEETNPQQIIISSVQINPPGFVPFIILRETFPNVESSRKFITHLQDISHEWIRTHCRNCGAERKPSYKNWCYSCGESYEKL